MILLSVVCCYNAVSQQSGERINPEINGSDNDTGNVVGVSPSFVNAEANHIKLNGADWQRLRAVFAGADSTVVRVLHIGDSHIQAEGITSRVRRHIQSQFGSAGRGLVAPLRLAGTNAPADYSLKSGSSLRSSRMLKKPWSTPMGFSGVAVQPVDDSLEFSISCGDAFDRLRIYATDEFPIAVECAETEPDYVYSPDSACVTDVRLLREVNSVAIKLRLSSGAAVTAIELLNGDTGVEYSAIGNNGATFANYVDLPGFAASTAILAPDLIIISLGTNEAFGRISDADMAAQIHSMVSSLRYHNPDATLLLTTPQECYKRTTSRRGRGRRRRRVRSYAVNTNIERMRRIINEYGEAHGIAVYDWYEIAGGADSASKWLSHRLMNTDRIHLTWDGYHLMGDMLATALIGQLSGTATDKDNAYDDSVR